MNDLFCWGAVLLLAIIAASMRQVDWTEENRKALRRHSTSSSKSPTEQAK